MGTVVHIQGNPNSPLTPLILIHAISGLALPCFALGDLSRNDFNEGQGRPVYGLSSPIFEESTSASRRRLNKRTLPSLAQEYVNIPRREIQPSGPYLLGGWSLGGLIAVDA